MNRYPIGTEPFHFVEPKQAHIYKRLLELLGPGLAAFYRDACRLMSTNPAFDTTTHLVGHALREIESALCAVVLSVADQAELSAVMKRPQKQNKEAGHDAKIQ